jgi:hypothetical protein
MLRCPSPVQTAAARALRAVSFTERTAPTIPRRQPGGERAAARQVSHGADERPRIDGLGEMQLEAGRDRLLPVLAARERGQRGSGNGRDRRQSEVSRICSELDPLVEAFRSRPSTGEHPYLWVDATYHKVRVDGRVTSQATVVAVGVTAEGERQVLGVDVGPSEDRAFWTASLRGLGKRGLRGVKLVISDAHEGLKAAIAMALTGATWQRCRAHFMRNRLATVPQGAREAIAAIVRTIFAQPDHATAMTQLKKVAEGLRPRLPRAATLLEDAAEDVLAYRLFPSEHQRQLHSTNVLERLDKEIKRRSTVVGIFLSAKSTLRPGWTLVGTVLRFPSSVHAVVELREDTREFPPLDGTLPLNQVCATRILLTESRQAVPGRSERALRSDHHERAYDNEREREHVSHGEGTGHEGIYLNELDSNWSRRPGSNALWHRETAGRACARPRVELVRSPRLSRRIS